MNINRGDFEKHLAIVCAIKAHVNAGGDFPAKMTKDDAINQILRVISTNLNAPTRRLWGFYQEELVPHVDVTTVGEAFCHNLNDSFTTDYSVLFANPDHVERLQERVRKYLERVRCGDEMPTHCEAIPFVPHLFAVENETYSFDVEAFREFEKSLPADAFVPFKLTTRMKLAHNTSTNFSQQMAVANAIKAYVDKGGNFFTTNMTDITNRVVYAVCANGDAPTWLFTGPDDTGAMGAEITTVFNVFQMGVTEEPIIFGTNFDNCADAVWRRVCKVVDLYLGACFSFGLEWPTRCAKYPRVPLFFRFIGDDEYAFDDQAFRDFVNSLPADAYSGDSRQVGTKDMDGVDFSTLYCTLKGKFGLSELDARVLVTAMLHFKLTRDDIKDIAQYAVKNPDAGVASRLIVVLSGRLGVDREKVMKCAVMDEWASSDVAQYFGMVKDGFPNVSSRMRELFLK